VKNVGPIFLRRQEVNESLFLICTFTILRIDASAADDSVVLWIIALTTCGGKVSPLCELDLSVAVAGSGGPWSDQGLQRPV